MYGDVHKDLLLPDTQQAALTRLRLASTLKPVRPGTAKPARQARPSQAAPSPSKAGSDYHLLRDAQLVGLVMVGLPSPLLTVCVIQPPAPATSSSPHVIDPKSIELGKTLGSGEFGAVCQVRGGSMVMEVGWRSWVGWLHGALARG